MDLINILLFCLMSLIIGAVLMLVVQYYAFVKFLNLPEDDERRKSLEERYNLPENIISSMNSSDNDSKTSTAAVNLIMQFLFYELRYSNQVRKWFHRKLTLELDELISKTTIGRLFDKLSIRELDFGHEFPEIKTMKVHGVDCNSDEGFIESLDVLLNIHYEGKFKLTIDADMVLGKKGSLSVKVRHLSGLARLQFTRHPYTHWSLCFIGDPQIELGIESKFQGRQMQSNVTSLISNQIRKAIRRKHTLPNYKIRYKPFFHRIDEDIDLSDVSINGNLEVTIKELTRLMIPNRLTHVYCVLTLAPIPWILARQRDDQNIIISLNIKIHKAKNQQVGIIFKQTEQLVMVDAVIPNTPAAKANLNKGDILLSIEGKKISHINHVAKIIKNLNRPSFTMRIERIVPGIIKNDALLEDYELSEDFQDTISFSKQWDAVQISSKLTRKSSVDKSSDSSRADTPTHTPSRRTKLSRDNSEQNQNDSRNLTMSSGSEYGGGGGGSTGYDGFQQHSTIDCEMNSFIRMDDMANFKLNENGNYLNLNVFGRTLDDITLLGYVNIPIRHMLYECGESTLCHFKRFSLLPPDKPNLQDHQLSSLSGFNTELCYGDILLSFVWSGFSNSSGIDTNLKRSRVSIVEQQQQKIDIDAGEKFETVTPPKQHDFIRTHFNRSTACDYCGKKIWLKDAVQCKECAMTCHKKCITKCQNSTICGPIDTIQAPAITSTSLQPELKVSEPESFPLEDNDDFESDDNLRNKLDAHRQSFSDLLVQGIKRVNSANNLAIPGIVSSLGQSSRSLPPSPQHTPRKQSLASMSSNPFEKIIAYLEILPDSMNDLTRDMIIELVEPIVGYGTPDELMSLAKTASKILFIEITEPNERVDKINLLLSKLRLALDSETIHHGNLEAAKQHKQIIQQQQTSSGSVAASFQLDQIRVSSDSTILLQTKAPPTTGNDKKLQISKQNSTDNDLTRRAFLIGQSEERVQALSVIMLYLCSGLQHAQGVASQ